MANNYSKKLISLKQCLLHTSSSIVSAFFIDARENGQESEPLISQHASETYMAANAVAKEYKQYLNSDNYRWHAPELFEPDDGMVYTCGKSDVYSLCLVLWESCNGNLFL